MRGTIYVIQNQVNQKVYVGQTKSGHPKDRFNQHKRLARTGKGSIIHAAMRKYGEDNFILIETIDTEWENLNKLEETTIKKYNSVQPNGYNILAWGSVSNLDIGYWTGKQRAESTKQKISETKTGTMMGADNPFYGQNHTTFNKQKSSEVHKEQWHSLTEEQKQQKIKEIKDRAKQYQENETPEQKQTRYTKISEANKGRQPSELARQRSRETKLGTHHSEATKAKMSIAKLGKLKSEETKANMTKAQRNQRTPEQIERVLKIREMLSQNMSPNSIAAVIGCTAEYVRKIRKGQRGKGI